MDREIIYAVLLAVFGTFFVSSYYFGDSGTSASTGTPQQVEAYDPSDIRYKVQEEERKKAAKLKGKKVHTAPADDSYSGEEIGESAGDSEIEQAPAEEPSID